MLCSPWCRRRVPADAGRVAETIMCGADQITEVPFEPSFERPLPPLYTCENEVQQQLKKLLCTLFLRAHNFSL